MALIKAYFNNDAKDPPFKCRQKRSSSGKVNYQLQRMSFQLLKVLHKQKT